jgi:hypothetical protein
MPSEFASPELIDERFGWSIGTAKRLARKGRLPHYLLPDGTVAFLLAEVEALVQRRPMPGDTSTPTTGPLLPPRSMM